MGGVAQVRELKMTAFLAPKMTHWNVPLCLAGSEPGATIIGDAAKSIVSLI